MIKMPDINYEISLLELRLRGTQQLLTTLTKKYNIGIETRYNPTTTEIQAAVQGSQAALDQSHYKQWNTIALLSSSNTRLQNLFENNVNINNFIGCNWIVDQATYLSGMFFNCTNLVKVNLSGWILTANTSLANMFSGCISLEYVNLSEWKTSAQLTDISGMFVGCVNLKSLDLHGWDTSAVIDASNMFRYCSSLSVLNLQGWDTTSLQNISGMFENCTSITSLNLSDWNTSAITTITDLFSNCISLQSLNLSNWVLNAVQRADPTVFQGCVNLKKLIFNNCSSSVLTKISPYPANQSIDSLIMNNCTFNGNGDITGFVGSIMFTSFISRDSELIRGRTYANLFEGLTCSTIDLGGLNFNSATNGGGWFQNCSRLTNLLMYNWNMTGVSPSLNNMFNECLSLKTIDLSRWNLDNVDVYQAFYNCIMLTTIIMDNVVMNSAATHVNKVFDYNFNLKNISVNGCVTKNDDGTDNLTTINNIVGLFNSDLNFKVKFVPPGTITIRFQPS